LVYVSQASKDLRIEEAYYAGNLPKVLIEKPHTMKRQRMLAQRAGVVILGLKTHGMLWWEG
jgi:hypothetical protein